MVSVKRQLWALKICNVIACQLLYVNARNGSGRKFPTGLILSISEHLFLIHASMLNPSICKKSNYHSPKSNELLHPQQTFGLTKSNPIQTNPIQTHRISKQFFPFILDTRTKRLLSDSQHVIDKEHLYRATDHRKNN